MTTQRKVAVLLVMALGLFGVTCYSLGAEVDTLLCDRTTDVCTLTRSEVVNLAEHAYPNVQQFPLHALTGAELGVSRSSGRSSGTSASLVLRTKDGPIKFMDVALSTADIEEQVADINRFLATPSMPRLSERRDNHVKMSLVAAFPSLLCAGMFLLVRGKGRAQKKRLQQQRQVCDVLGFTLEEGPVRELGVRFGVFPWLSRAGGIHEGRGLMTGSRAGHQVTILDHSYGGVRETLAVFPEGAKGLPDVEMLPRGSRFGTWVLDTTWLDIRFPENQEFSTHYELRGTDEAAVRRAFGKATLAFFASHQQCWVETRGGGMTVYRFATLCALAELPVFLDDAVTVLGAFHLPDSPQ
jgi:hypothetical protein